MKRFLILVLCVAVALVGIYLYNYPLTTGRGYGKSEVIEIGTAAAGYVEEYGRFPPHRDEEFREILLGENIAGSNPKEIRFLSIRSGRKVGHDVWGRSIRVLLSKDVILTWSAGLDGVFEDLPGEGDDIAFTTEPPPNVQQ